MQLTEEQKNLILGFAILFVIFMVASYVVDYILRKLKKAFRKIYHGIKRRVTSRVVKKQKGYQNYENNTWYPDGTLWNANTKKLEQGDYKTRK